MQYKPAGSKRKVRVETWQQRHYYREHTGMIKYSTCDTTGQQAQSAKTQKAWAPVETYKKVDSGNTQTRKENRENYCQSLRLKAWQTAKFSRCLLKRQQAKAVSWNCDDMRSRRRITSHYLQSKNILICLVQETKEEAFVDSNSGEYRYISTAGKVSQSGGVSGGVGAWIHHSCKVLNYEQVQRNILMVEVDMANEHATLLSAYAPVDRAPDPDKFWSKNQNCKIKLEHIAMV